MEDVLAVYTRPYDRRAPQVCMDEVSKQLLSEKRAALPMEPGHPERQDYEYERHGVCNIFLACEPLAGKRYTKVTTQRTKVDWALFIREVVDLHYPDAQKIVFHRVLLLPVRRNGLKDSTGACTVSRSHGVVVQLMFDA